MVILTEEQIRTLITERKPVPAQLQPLKGLTLRSHHERRDFKISAPSGNQFCVFVRRGVLNMLDFSVVLGYELPSLHKIFRLRRYNGRAHFHTNVLEKQTFYDYHIHTATERYQKHLGFREEHFAEVTDRFQDLAGAIECMMADCGFRIPFEETSLYKGEPI